MTDLARRLAAARVVICAGPGGVGKTTIAATVALALAARGRRVAVVTIDPARRLAEALGLEQLANVPRRVDPARLAAAGLPAGGELWAMMLDVQRTFDDVIARLAPDPRTRDEILANPVYRQLSTAVAGSQEYGAIAKLFELDREGGFDVIVLDTPPSRNALDFLDAPERLTAFLEGRALSAFLLPSGAAARAAGLVLAALRRVTGVGLLDELATFLRLLAGLVPGLRERATGVRTLLTAPSTAFLLVTGPERGALDETIFFAGELAAAGMHRAGIVVNRVQPLHPGGADVAATTARLAATLGAPLAAQVARAHADLQVLARRDHAAVARLHRALGGGAPLALADRAGDVHDLHALADLTRALAPAAASHWTDIAPRTTPRA